MTYIVSPPAGLGGGISWRPLAYNLLISTSKTYWRPQPTAARRSSIFSEIHGALCTQDVSFNNACMRTVCKWHRRNNGL